MLATHVAKTMGEFGDYLIKFFLGILVILIGSIILLAGSRVEYPEVKRSGQTFTEDGTWNGLLKSL